jgi:hypothetical protein
MVNVEAGSAEIVDASIDKQIEAGDQTVGTFVREVENRVEKSVGVLRAEFGDSVTRIASKAMQNVRGYRQAQLNLFKASFNVKHTEREGAAAWNEKGGDNSIAVGLSAMEQKKDNGYWRRVVIHEETHQLEQAVTYNRGSIVYPGDPKPLEVQPCLVEWHAITKAKQPSTDLTSDYQDHKRRGDALVQFLGTSEPLITALKTGDMQSLQDLINQKLVLLGQPLSAEVANGQEYHVVV